MITLDLVLKLIISLSILNVWLLRYGKSTPWRGGNAQNMKEEFSTYGLPGWFMLIIGGAKVILSILLIASIWYEQFETISAMGIALLMMGAVSMHIKVKDPLKKSFPAFLFLLLSVLIIWL